MRFGKCSIENYRINCAIMQINKLLWRELWYNYFVINLKNNLQIIAVEVFIIDYLALGP